jgi:hypothetical protein
MKKIFILVVVAAALIGAALWLKDGNSKRTADIVGKKVLPEFNISQVSRVEIAGAKSLALMSSDDAGWTVDALYGYPADAKKILDELLKLKELKAGQPAAGISNAAPTTVVLKDAAGKELAKLVMGEQHRSAPRGEMAQFGGGGYPDGRYVTFEGATVLVNDALDAFDGDPKKWVDTKVCDITPGDVKEVTYAKGKETVKLTRKDSTWTLEGLGPKEELDTSKTYSLDSALSYLSFSSVVDPKKAESEFGFATGAVYTATLKNGITYTAKVGNKIGADSAFKVSAAFKPVGTNATENAACEKTVKEFNDRVGKWTYVIPSYKAESLSKARKDLVKAKEEPKKEEAKPAEKKPEAKPVPTAKPAEAKPAPAAAKPTEAKKPEPKKVETKPVEKKVESKPTAKPAPAPAAKPAPAPAAKPAPAPAAKK